MTGLSASTTESYVCGAATGAGEGGGGVGCGAGAGEGEGVIVGVPAELVCEEDGLTIAAFDMENSSNWASAKSLLIPTRPEPETGAPNFCGSSSALTASVHF